MLFSFVPLFYYYYQQTPLHIAAKEGHDHTVKYLVDKGADIHIKDINGVNDEYCFIFGFELPSLPCTQLRVVNVCISNAQIQ